MTFLGFPVALWKFMLVWPLPVYLAMIHDFRTQKHGASCVCDRNRRDVDDATGASHRQFAHVADNREQDYRRLRKHRSAMSLTELRP